MEKGKERLTPENCPEHGFTRTFKNNEWTNVCRCGFWYVSDEHHKVLRTYKQRENDAGKKSSAKLSTYRS